jgi:hypothetical protein
MSSNMKYRAVEIPAKDAGKYIANRHCGPADPDRSTRPGYSEYISGLPNLGRYFFELKKSEQSSVVALALTTDNKWYAIKKVEPPKPPKPERVAIEIGRYGTFVSAGPGGVDWLDCKFGCCPPDEARYEWLAKVAQGLAAERIPFEIECKPEPKPAVEEWEIGYSRALRSDLISAVRYHVELDFSGCGKTLPPAGFPSPWPLVFAYWLESTGRQPVGIGVSSDGKFWRLNATKKPAPPAPERTWIKVRQDGHTLTSALSAELRKAIPDYFIWPNDGGNAMRIAAAARKAVELGCPLLIENL